jgi:hypothetical protein
MGIKNDEDLRNYTDYAKWIRQEPARSFFEKILFNKEAIYPEYIDRKTVQRKFLDHMYRRKDYQNDLCLAFTFEIWLQQIYFGRYRKHLI